MFYESEGFYMKYRLKQIRKNQSMSQIAFGKSLGVSRDVISNYEMGRVEPTDLFINHLCNTYHINENWLRFGIGDMYIQTKETILDELVFIHGLNERETAVIKAFLDLSPEGRAGVLEYADKIVKLNHNIHTPISDTQYSFRAARSKNNTEPTIVDSNEKRILGLHKAAKLSSDDEL